MNFKKIADTSFKNRLQRNKSITYLGSKIWDIIPGKYKK